MKQIDNRDFVVTYMNSDSIADIGKAMGMTPAGVSAKAAYLRRLGVKLPKMRRQMSDRPLEVAQLNSLINKHNKERQGR